MTLHLVRHAKAGPRGPISDDDPQRHLSQAGHEQARGLIAHFEATPIRAIWSSRAVRCQETVDPLAAAHGLAVITVAGLMEGTNAIDLIHLLREEAAAEHDLVLCSHGDLIPAALNRLVQQGTSVQGARGCEKGSVWALTTSGHDIVSASYTARPGVSDR